MMSRTIEIVSGLLSPSRTKVSSIPVPGLPRMMFTASSMVMLSVDCLLILRMISPALTPALSAGVPSIGAITVSAPSF